MVTLSQSFTPVPVLQISCSFQLFVTGAIHDGSPMADGCQLSTIRTEHTPKPNV